MKDQTPTPHTDPTTSRFYATLLLLLAKALKRAKVDYVEVTDGECERAVKAPCPIKLVQERDPHNPLQQRVRACLSEPLPPEEKKRIITTDDDYFQAPPPIGM